MQQRSPKQVVSEQEPAACPARGSWHLLQRLVSLAQGAANEVLVPPKSPRLLQLLQLRLQSKARATCSMAFLLEQL